MELSELKMISASNIINLRTQKGLTQAELGELINYSDKTISKWERAEAIPDAFVLTRLAEIFGVTVDYILSSHTAWELPHGEGEKEETKEVTYNTNAIIAIAVFGVMTLALTVFITMWILGIPDWRVFPVGLSVAILVFMILQCCFNKAHMLKIIIDVFITSLFADAYLIVPSANIWQIFILLIPAFIIVNLSFRVKISRKIGFLPRKKGDSTNSRDRK